MHINSGFGRLLTAQRGQADLCCHLDECARLAYIYVRTRRRHTEANMEPQLHQQHGCTAPAVRSREPATYRRPALKTQERTTVDAVIRPRRSLLNHRPKLHRRPCALDRSKPCGRGAEFVSGPVGNRNKLLSGAKFRWKVAPFASMAATEAAELIVGRAPGSAGTCGSTPLNAAECHRWQRQSSRRLLGGIARQVRRARRRRVLASSDSKKAARPVEGVPVNLRTKRF
jgi:hypothetical protein